MEDKILYDYAMSFVGVPYRWGGDDPIAGIDCSGLMIVLLQSCGRFPMHQDATAQGLYNRFKGNKLKTPQFGALALFGKDDQHITHIGMCLDSYRMIHAGGGGSRVTNRDQAAVANAYVAINPVTYRSDLVAIVNPF